MYFIAGFILFNPFNFYIKFLSFNIHLTFFLESVMDNFFPRPTKIISQYLYYKHIQHFFIFFRH